ncbi:MAG: hypothetical protein D6800_07150 [Candidatus Zixiibacteriota bacterium]|nr:MAG: hypothetical protein D6800_07150 [candidate division Zixibacteria bacterium]
MKKRIKEPRAFVRNVLRELSRDETLTVAGAGKWTSLDPDCPPDPFGSSQAQVCTYQWDE